MACASHTTLGHCRTRAGHVAACRDLPGVSPLPPAACTQMAKQIDHIQRGLKAEMEYSTEAVAAVNQQGIAVNVPGAGGVGGMGPMGMLAGHGAMDGSGM